MSDQMEFPNTFDEFADYYGFKDSKEIYTNGSMLIPVFRVKQWLDHTNKTTQMIDKSNFDEKQYKTDLMCAYDCGYKKAMSIIEDNIKAEIVKTVCEESNQCDGDSGDLKWCAGLGYSLKIIDKHIAESEE